LAISPFVFFALFCFPFGRDLLNLLFMLEEGNPGEYVKLKRNPNWWFGTFINKLDIPYFEGVKVSVIPLPPSAWPLSEPGSWIYGGALQGYPF
jgi:hypothetical protein